MSVADRMYLLTDSSFVLTCCGRISQWEIHHSVSGYLDLVVWRPTTSGRYKVVGVNTILVNGELHILWISVSITNR
jgi:hypothetical protein